MCVCVCEREGESEGERARATERRHLVGRGVEGVGVLLLDLDLVRV